ncbi:hypothetical protein CDL12_30098 [Handroanthus impetiginosus]|uniref:Uncharacterized protein n=1 Tax=Handroanthus impetiginosus TaxID=429701 RepID=A0A2G9FWK1_9LAMI|nr:hypothetical protein CDL12_30098 [Handroanthus impetiginosus]
MKKDNHQFPIPTKTMGLKAILHLVLVALMAIAIAEAQNPIEMVRVNGTLYCSRGGGPGGSGNSAPVFPDAQVEIFCMANVISNSPVRTKNKSDGAYVLTLTPQPSATIESIIANCRIFVRTPVSSCNAELASAGFASNMQSVKTGPDGSSSITYMIFIHNLHDYCRFFTPRSTARSAHIVWICLAYE